MRLRLVFAILPFAQSLGGAEYLSAQAGAPACVVRSADAAFSNLTELDRFLTHLDSHNPTCISHALTQLKARFASGVLPVPSDSAFVLFRRFFYSVLENYRPPVDPTATFPADLLDSLAREGLRPVQTLFGYRVSEEVGFLLNQSAPYVSEAMRSFLKLVDSDRGKPFCEDGTLMVPFDNTGDRIANWASFVHRYPDFILHREAAENAHNYLAVFLNGLNNTPLFDESLGTDQRYHWTRLRPEVRAAYEHFIAVPHDSATARLVGGFYELLRANAFNWSEAVPAYQARASLPHFGC